MLSFIAYFLIPAYTVLFVQGSNWFDTNFSVIGNLIGRQEEFVLWGLIVGVYFFYVLRKIIRLLPARPPATWLIPFSLVLLTCSITTPYLPDVVPFQSFLHTVFAFLSSCCLLLCLYALVLHLHRTKPKQYRKYLLGLIFITGMSVVLFLIAGIVSSALEIFFTISTTVLVRRLYEKVQTTEASAQISRG